MAFVLQTLTLKVPETEELIDSGPKRALYSDSFCFAVTKEAVYLPTRKRGFVLREPIETTRVPLSSIHGVALYPARAGTARIIIIWTLLTLVFALMAITDILKNREWRFGLLFLAVLHLYNLSSVMLGPRGRYCVRVDILPQPLDFEPRLAIISTEAKAAELANQAQFLDACRRAGLSVIDSRNSPELITHRRPEIHS